MPRRQANRELRLSSLEEDLLTLLVGRDLCAQDMIQHLTEASEGHAGVVQSTSYSVLPRMEEKGWLSSTWAQPTEEGADHSRRRYYTLTKAGLRILQERRRFRARLDARSIPPEGLTCPTSLNPELVVSLNAD